MVTPLHCLRKGGQVTQEKKVTAKRTYKITLVLMLLTLVLFSANVTLVSAESYDYVGEWGSFGSLEGQFNGPGCIAIDNNGNVFIVDYGNYRIEKFSNNGTFVTSWGSYGSGNSKFTQISGLAVDEIGNVYVNDQTTYCIQKFTNNGIFITKWGNTGSGEGEFKGHNGLAIRNGYIYVTDPNGFQVRKFTSNGTFVKAWGSNGTDEGQFNYPNGIAVDSDNNVYVSDVGNYRIQKFTSDGVFVTQWGGYGAGEGQFKAPIDIAIDNNSKIYVTDPNNNRVEKFSSEGVFLALWGSSGSGEGQFSVPIGVAVDNKGFVFVTDPLNERVQKFSMTISISPPEPDNLALIVAIFVTIAIIALIGILLLNHKMKGNTVGSHVFISYVKADETLAEKISTSLEQSGYKTLCSLQKNSGFKNEPNSKKAIEHSQAIIILISNNSISSDDITNEVRYAYELEKPFIPILVDMEHDEFQKRQPEWQEAIGATTSITIPPEGIESIMPRIKIGLEVVGVKKKRTKNAN
jgi:sugar lactone lactonase YvrE